MSKNEKNTQRQSERQQGYGCMGLSAFYTSAQRTTKEQARDVVRHALSKGVTLLNTATFYGELNEEGFGANLRLLRHCLEGVPREQYQLMVKVGMDTRCPVEKTGTSWVMRGDAASLHADVDYALSQLDTPYLDIIVLCRVPRDVPIEESMRALQSIVDAGKARAIGLSEASAEIIARAAKIAPVYCIEQEWSLWARDAEREIVPLCRQLGIKIVAYSPLGRGFLTGTLRSREDNTLSPSDYRLCASPKFAAGNFEHNLQLVEAVRGIAERKGVSLGQLALAWLHAQGDDVIPIPGTSSITHLDENLHALDVSLSEEEKEEIENVFREETVQGLRYPGNHFTFHHNPDL